MELSDEFYKAKYEKLFSFKVGEKELESLEVIKSKGYNVSSILRRALNEIAGQIEQGE